MQRPNALAPALLALAGTTAASHAGFVDWSDITPGARSASFVSDGVGVTVSTNTRRFSRKSRDGTTAIGVSGGSVHGEISGDEALTINFDSPVTITDIQLAFLFPSGMRGDTVGESASITTDSNTSYVLLATGATDAFWSGSGTTANNDPADDNGTGRFAVSGDDILGSPVTALTLSPGNTGHAGMSDFGFVSLAFQAVSAALGDPMVPTPPTGPPDEPDPGPITIDDDPITDPPIDPDPQPNPGPIVTPEPEPEPIDPNPFDPPTDPLPPIVIDPPEDPVPPVPSVPTPSTALVLLAGGVVATRRRR